MESLIQKLKTNATITLILGVLSVTWIIIDYFVFDAIMEKGLSKFSLEWILLIFSAAAILVFHISALSTLFYSFRVVRKVKKGMKSEIPETPKEINQIQNMESDPGNE